MDMLKKYLLSNVYRSPDEPVAAEGVAEQPAVVVAEEPSAEPAEEPTPEAGAQPVEHGNKGKQPWFLQRISETAQRARTAEERAAAAEERERAATAMLQRLQGGDKEPPQIVAPPPQDFDAAVDARAEQKLFFKDSVKVLNNGTNKFADFGETRSILGAIGALEDNFVKDVIGVDKSNAHVILDKLAKDPERTAALVRMDSRSRIAELTRLSMAAAAPVTPEPTTPLKPAVPAKTVSKAPNPAPPVEPSASKIIDGYSDDATEEQFTAQFNDRMKQRSVRR